MDPISKRSWTRISQRTMVDYGFLSVLEMRFVSCSMFAPFWCFVITSATISSFGLGAAFVGVL